MSLLKAVRFFATIFFLFNNFIVWANPPKIKFIENKCQWPDAIQFSARIGGGNMDLHAGGFAYTFIDQERLDELHDRGHHSENEVMPTDLQILVHRVQVSFLGSNKICVPRPISKLTEYYNYFLGSDPSAWSSNVAAYEGVLYPDYYKGIDLKVYSQGSNIKYDFNVAAGADPSLIKFSYAGADLVTIENGDLVVTASKFTFHEKKPIAFQIINGEKHYVQCSYVLLDDQVSFQFPESYDACYPLVIDPLLIFSTYSGSTADNWGSTATPGERGKLYSAGVTNRDLGGMFPATVGAFQINYGGLYDVGILKYDSTGQQLLYASHLGGSGSESAHSLVINAQNELLVLGTTSSLNFPTTAGAIDNSFNGGTGEFNVIFYNGGSDLFIAKISANGGQLLGSTYLGGSANDGMNPGPSKLVANYGDQLRGDIITDLDGNIYVSSVTQSSNFPVVNSFGLTYSGGLSDALVLKVNSSLTQLIWAAFIGGSAEDASHTIKLDQAGDLFIGGGTASLDFTTTINAYQTTHAGTVDGWMAKLKPDGSEILAATLTGTNAFDQVYFLDLNSSGDLYVYGQTAGTSFPITAGVYKNANSGQFLQKFSNDLTTLNFSTVFGSGTPVPNISPTAFLVNDCNNIYMSGWGGPLNSALGFWNSSTAGMPITFDGYQKTTSGSDFYFIVLTDDATELLYATYLGGNLSKTHVDGGTSRFDKGGIVYHAVCSGCQAFNPSGASSSDFPTTGDAWSRQNKSLNCNNAAFKFDLSSLKARIQTNSVTLDMPGLNRVCLPDAIVFQNKSTGGQFYEWDFGDGGQLLKQDTTFIMHAYKEPGTYRVKLLAIDIGTCVGRDSTFTNVTVSRPGGFAGPDQVMCFDAGARLLATGGVTYQWENWAKTFKSNEASPLVNPIKDDGYVVTIGDAMGCIKKDTVNIKVVPGIDLKFEYSKMYDCFNRPTIQVMNLSDPTEDVFFDFGDGITSDLDATTHTYNQDGVFALKLVGRKESCIYEDRVDVPVFELKVPNVITPDEFPENNDFVILYAGKRLSLSSLTSRVVIYNRWGGKVFESTDYQDDWSGENVEAGIYYYDIKVEGEAACKGWVQVIK
ncbi:MAG: gliding motility-associated C-terminal domain-containing protein [Cyclobacteriaceae bacterium]|nr:gliding motility-associated C-terminal domain-containing protein [Cyclobacteriaceae bacterium]